MKTLTERIAHVMKAMRWTTAQEVATAAKVSRSAASQWLGNTNKPIYTLGSKSAFNLAQATGFSARWLSSGDGPERQTAPLGGLVAAEPVPLSLDAALERVGASLARHMAPRRRDELADAMHGWAKHDGSENYRRLVLELLAAPGSVSTHHAGRVLPFPGKPRHPQKVEGTGTSGKPVSTRAEICAIDQSWGLF